MDLIQERIDEQIERMEAAHKMADAARTLNYDEDHAVIQIAQDEYHAANAARRIYQALYEDLESRWQTKEEEYPVATYVWKYLADKGYNDEVIAGILGSMMVEVGGHTLNLQWWLYGSSYYGLCQWSKGYPEIWGKDLEAQCEFLESTIEYELNTYGYMYKKGYDYEDFVLMKDIKDAALMFAKSYERCGASTHKLRQ